MGQNSRAAGLFRTEVKTLADGRAWLHWEKIEQWRDRAALVVLASSAGHKSEVSSSCAGGPADNRQNLLFVFLGEAEPCNR